MEPRSSPLPSQPHPPKASLLRSTGFGMFLLGAALALGFVVAARELSRAVTTLRERPNIRVKGSAERDVRAARASWSGTIAAQGATLPEAYAALDAASARVRGLVLQRGFAAGDVRLSSVSSESVHERDARGTATNRIESWRLSRSIRVESPDVSAVEALSVAATDLVGEGVEISSNAPEFVLTDLETLKKGLLEEATRNGHERARILAEGGGGGVGPLASVSQGVFQIVPRGSVEVSDYGAYDTTSIEKTIKAVVTLEYSIRR
ncbi:MAG: SIMPL domain-containing protein [Planctomycetes bacterium]|nr:SIMPL domain-containing protein [Planctomycetota bacterium]